MKGGKRNWWERQRPSSVTQKTARKNLSYEVEGCQLLLFYFVVVVATFFQDEINALPGTVLQTLFYFDRDIYGPLNRKREKKKKKRKGREEKRSENKQSQKKKKVKEGEYYILAVRIHLWKKEYKSSS